MLICIQLKIVIKAKTTMIDRSAIIIIIILFTYTFYLIFIPSTFNNYLIQIKKSKNIISSKTVLKCLLYIWSFIVNIKYQ